MDAKFEKKLYVGIHKFPKMMSSKAIFCLVFVITFTVPSIIYSHFIVLCNTQHLFWIWFTRKTTQ